MASTERADNNKTIGPNLDLSTEQYGFKTKAKSAKEKGKLKKNQNKGFLKMKFIQKTNPE